MGAGDAFGQAIDFNFKTYFKTYLHLYLFFFLFSLIFSFKTLSSFSLRLEDLFAVDRTRPCCARPWLRSWPSML